MPSDPGVNQDRHRNVLLPDTIFEPQLGDRVIFASPFDTTNPT